MRLAARVAITLAISSSAAARAATIHVPADQPTLQAGIDAAAAGDTVLVAPGIYAGPGNRDLDFGGNDVVLRSEDGAEATIIDCEMAGRAIRFHSGETRAAVVDGFTIQNGRMSGSDPATFGGGIAVAGATPTIARCIFLGNSAASGGALACLSFSGHSPAISECIFSDNSASLGGALYNEASPQITDCVFTANTGAQGGALASYTTAGRPVLARCTFTGNSSSVGGAIFFIESTVALSDCIFTGNSATEDAGGLFAGNSATCGFIRTVFAGNTAALTGGAVCCAANPGYDASIALDQCTLAGNAAGVAGAGLFVAGAFTATLTNTIIAASSDGDAVACGDGGPAVTLACCDLSGNAGGDWIGCIAGQAGTSGNISENPLFCDAAAGDLRIDDSSPCAPAQSGACGLIGAFEPADCIPNAVEPATWGRVKAGYRR